MAKEELKAFVDRYRAQGKTDEQIRATLSELGWGNNDINAAFGLESFESAEETQVAETSTPHEIPKLVNYLNKRYAIRVGIVLGSIIGVIILALVARAVFKNHPSNQKQTSDNQSQTSQSAQNKPCVPSSLGLPSNFPSDITTYPKSNLASIDQQPSVAHGYVIANYCSSDSPSKIVSYLTGHNKNWKLAEAKQTDSNRILQGESSTQKLYVLIGSKDGSTNIQFAVTNK